MSSSVIDLYDRLRTAPDDETRARIIAEAFETLEERYPHLGDMATRTNLSETELRLIKEIEQVRADLSKDIEQVRAELKETELRLVKEIEQVRADLSKEIEQVRADLSKEIEQVRADLSKEIEQVRADLSKEIEQVRAELRETELRLVKEIEQLRGDLRKEIEQVRVELKVELARSHTAWLKWSFLFWLTQFSAILLLLWRVWPGNG